MLDQIIHTLFKQESIRSKYSQLFSEINIGPKTTLIKEGEICKNIFFIKKGCLRLWFNNQGRDITFQFFFENQAVSCFLGRKPSLFTLESIEPSTVLILKKNDLNDLLSDIPEFKDVLLELLLQRLEHYSQLFLSRIKDNPQKRYDELLKENPHIVLRVPQHYIASYLGITPVSLSRIRNRKNKIS